MAINYASLLAYIEGLYADGALSEQDYNKIIVYILANGNLENSPRDLIQIRRGNKANLPTLAQGEMAFTLDEQSLYVGGMSGNIEMINVLKFLAHAENSALHRVNVKEYGAKGDGLTDDTAAIQLALNEGGTIYFPPGTYMINAETSISPVSNSHITLHNGATIKSIANSLDTYYMVLLSGVNNVTIEGGVIEGDRVGHTGITGEHGHGLRIYDSSNIVIKDLKSINCWGDGINIYDVTNVLIDNCVCDNNRRQGITITGGTSITVRDCKCINTNGAAPQAGLDIEPNYAVAVLKDIKIINLSTENNNGYGITINTTNMTTPKEISITIDGHTDYGSVGGFATTGINTLTGFIKVVNSCYEKNKSYGFSLNYFTSMPLLSIVNPIVKDWNQNNNNNFIYASPIIIKSSASQIAFGKLGNIAISGLYLEHSRTENIGVVVSTEDSAAVGIGKIAFTNPTKAHTYLSLVGIDNTLVYSDVNKQLKYTMTSNISVGSSVMSVINNDTATTARTVTLKDIAPIGYEVEIMVTNATHNILVYAENCIIKPLTSVVAKTLTLSGLGSFIKIRKIASDTWILLTTAGTVTSN